jgi:hypothetical protein
MHKLMVKKELFESFKELFTVYEPGVSYIGLHIEEKPLLIPRRYFGGSGNIAIPMKIKYTTDLKCEAILVEKKAYEELMSYFDVYEGEFDGPMLRKVFEFPSEHVPKTGGSFRLVCHLLPDSAIDEPKFKKDGEGYTIDI